MLNTFPEIIFTRGMKKSVRMPNMSEQQLLNSVKVRLITKNERTRHDKLLDEQHYLKSGQLVR